MILQANIVGYAGSGATILGYLDVEERKLYIKAVSNLCAKRFINQESLEQAGLISNVPTDDFDYFFSEDDFGQAFRDFKQFDSSLSLIFDGDTKRAIPRIEMNKITDSGTDYAISPDTSNAHIAVIALCFLARNAFDAHTEEQMYEMCYGFTV